MFSVQRYIPLKENICMGKVSGMVKIRNPVFKGAVQKFQRTQLYVPASMWTFFFLMYCTLLQHGYLISISTECTLHYSWIKMFPEIYRHFLFKTAYLANYRAKYVLSTQNLIAPVGSLVFIWWHCSVLCPFGIMETWTVVNSGHLPVTGNAVHFPGIMGIFPTYSGKMSLMLNLPQLHVKPSNNKPVTCQRNKCENSELT